MFISLGHITYWSPSYLLAINTSRTSSSNYCIWTRRICALPINQALLFFFFKSDRTGLVAYVNRYSYAFSPLFSASDTDGMTVRLLRPAGFICFTTVHYTPTVWFGRCSICGESLTVGLYNLWTWDSFRGEPSLTPRCQQPDPLKSVLFFISAALVPVVTGTVVFITATSISIIMYRQFR